MVAGTRVFTGAKKGSPSGCKKLGKHGSRKRAVRPGSAGHTSTAEVSTYYYHSDHLGSAHLITDYKGDEYERVEYTPYGEYWIEKRAPENRTLPCKFTGKERDEETGLYYYGARYLDAKTSRWLTTDPALGDYIPMAPVNDEAKKHNENLPGMGGIYNTVKYTDPTGEFFGLDDVFTGPVDELLVLACITLYGAVKIYNSDTNKRFSEALTESFNESLAKPKNLFGKKNMVMLRNMIKEET